MNCNTPSELGECVCAAVHSSIIQISRRCAKLKHTGRSVIPKFLRGLDSQASDDNNNLYVSDD